MGTFYSSKSTLDSYWDKEASGFTSLLCLQEFFLGSGGVFGLLQALVGEVLPGSARCLAVGNALLQGPVVFHFPQYLVGRIKQRAMEGDLAVLQLLVDLYR